ncbi:MAG: lamin tail domain-containing protein [Chryseolinea sp.]
MKNTPQLIGVSALLTFAVSVMPTQQMFAHLYLVINSSSGFRSELNSWKAVIITEIMADPSPPQGLPEVEYVELFNRSSVNVNLEGWKLSDASNTVVLNAITLEPGQYVAISSKPIVVGTSMMIVSSLPSLNNTGDSLTLSDAGENVVDAINYSDDWYHDEQRSQGGWALELIDVNNTCELSGNWTVSEDASGGTPGKENSVRASNPDVTGPFLTSVDVVDEQNLKVVFNEKLSSGTIESGQWTIVPYTGVMEDSFTDSSRAVVLLRLEKPLQGGILYSLSIESVYDCAGNELHVNSHNSFALPEPATSGDVLINEILFNPFPDGADFIEIINASSKYIALNGWAIGSIDEDGSSRRVLIDDVFVMRPGQYLAFTSDPSRLKAHYFCADSTIRQLKLPSFPDDKGGVFLSNEVDSVMDFFEYNSDMHNAFISDAEGVSLERISIAVSTDDVLNWTSASSASGYATPGLRNSAERVAEITERPVQVRPSAFTPMTGQPNFAEISYQMEQPGCIATVNIYDSRGMIVRHLANNTLLGTEGILRWEGEKDNGSRAQTGYYMVWFQVFAIDGSSRLFREPVAISARY